MTSKFSNLVILILVITSVWAVGCAQADNDDKSEQINPATPVSVTSLQTLKIDDTFIAIGKVIPEATYEVAVSLGGKVTALYVQEGEKVTKGQVLYELDQATLKNNKAQTERSLKTAIATLNDQVKATEKQLSKLVDQIADLEEQKRSLSEQPTSTPVPAVVAGVSESQLTAQISQLESTQDTLNNTLTTLRRNLSDANANYTTQMNNLQATIAERVLKSPADGMVTGVTFKVGELVGPQDVLKIVSDNTFAVESPLTASQLRRIEGAGAADTLGITLYLEGDAKRVIKGSIANSNVSRNAITNLYTIHISLDDQSLQDLYDGEYVEIHYLTETRITQSLPLAAIKRLGTDAFAYYVNNDSAKRVSVTLGAISGEQVEIDSGLEALPKDAQWILKGVDDLQDGSAVKVVK